MYRRSYEPFWEDLGLHRSEADGRLYRSVRGILRHTVEESFEAGEADITTRANQGWRATAPTLRECSPTPPAGRVLYYTLSSVTRHPIADARELTVRARANAPQICRERAGLCGARDFEYGRRRNGGLRATPRTGRDCAICQSAYCPARVFGRQAGRGRSRAEPLRSISIFNG